MQVVSTVKEVRDIVAGWRKEGKTVGFVPTMGYLHEGHGSLISKAVEQNDKAVVSIFVNPMQFGPTEDLESYPRDLEKDSKFCESLGADLIFHPGTGRNVSRWIQFFCGHDGSDRGTLRTEPSGSFPWCLYCCQQIIQYRSAGSCIFWTERCTAAGSHQTYGR